MQAGLLRFESLELVRNQWRKFNGKVGQPRLQTLPASRCNDKIFWQ